jgi:hypothetical protein
MTHVSCIAVTFSPTVKCPPHFIMGLEGIWYEDVERNQERIEQGPVA